MTMQLEQELVKWIRSVKERKRDDRQRALLDALGRKETVRLNLDAPSADYNQRLMEESWDSLAEVAPRCTPIGPGVWTEWTDNSLDNASVGCLIIVVAD